MAIKLHCGDTIMVLVALKVYRQTVAEIGTDKDELENIDRVYASYMRSAKALMRVGK